MPVHNFLLLGFVWVTRKKGGRRFVVLFLMFRNPFKRSGHSYVIELLHFHIKEGHPSSLWEKYRQKFLFTDVLGP